MTPCAGGTAGEIAALHRARNHMPGSRDESCDADRAAVRTDSVKPSFYFGIPLRAKRSARDWDQVCERFRATIRSIGRQTDPDFRVLVACHDLPELDGVDRSKLQFLTAEFAPPSADDFRGQMIDKGRKVHLMLSTIRRLGVGSYMQVDADDFVSRRIVAFVRSRPEVPGWVIRKGYEYKVGADFIQLNPVIHRHCGTTHIVNLRVDDLPPDMGDADSPEAPAKYVLRRPHHAWRRGFAAAGRSFRSLPFAGCVYVTGYSDNHSVNKPGIARHQRLGLRRLILSASPRLRLGEKIKDEFGF